MSSIDYFLSISDALMTILAAISRADCVGGSYREFCPRHSRHYNVIMKTLTVTEGRQNLGNWLKLALRGEDVGFLVDGRVVALRPVQVSSEDYVLQEYGVSERQAERAYKAAKADVKSARASGRTVPFKGSL